MEDFYSYCAVIAGTLLVGQLLLSLIGLGHHTDVHDLSLGDVDVDLDATADGLDHGGEWFVGMLSFRALVASLTVFGLVGLGTSQQFDPLNAFLIALACGGGVMYMVGWVMRTLYQMKSDGNIDIQQAVGKAGSVYLSIPGQKAGAGKVSLKVQGRAMEYRAMTTDEELPSGTPVVVRSVISPGIVEVAKATESPIEGDVHVQS